MLIDRNILEGKNILITGGAGYIGSSLCSKLKQIGSKITVIDNYFTGSYENHVDGVNYIKADTKDINNLDLNHNYDYIFHFGEYSRVEQSFEDIDKVFDYNHLSIYSILKFAHLCNAKIIYSGSSTKFGDDGDNAFASPYAWTKKTNSDLVRTYSKWNNLDHVIIYFYNVYGGREISNGKYATVIGIFTRLYKNEAKELPVVLPGTQERNFTHIDDIVNGIIIASIAGHGDGYGIGSDEEFSINDVVDMFGLKKKYLPERKGNRRTASLKTEKLKKLGWTPNKTLKNHINKMVQGK